MKKSKGLKAVIIDGRKFRSDRFNNPQVTSYSNIYPKLISGIQKAGKDYKDELKNPSSEIKEAPEEFWNEIIKIAESVGIGLVGFAPVDERFVFIKDHTTGIDFPLFYENAIVLGMEMKFDAIDTAPGPLAGEEAMRVYAELGVATNELTDYIRSKGYRAIACHPLGGPILYPAMAVNANMGEIGKQGLLVTKKYGPRQRLSMISVNASPLPKKPHEEMGISQFCEKCGKCSQECPGGAILESPMINENGTVTRIDNSRCFEYFYKTNGCSICIKVCPFHKKGYAEILSQK